MQRKAEAFGFTAVVIDGHDAAAIEDTLRRREELAAGKPLCIIARTVKGWGVPALSGMGHHGTPVPKDQLEAVLSELDKRAAELGIADLDSTAREVGLRIARPLPAPATKAAGQPMGFMAAIAKDPKLVEAVTGKKALSPRRAYGLALMALGAADPRVVALDADVKNSTYALEFAKAHPDRYFEARIAEQNMISAAAGLSAGGKVPFVSTFGRFLERGFDQIEMAIIGGANLKLVGTHVGVTLAADGPSQNGAGGRGVYIAAFAHVRDSRGNPAATVLTPGDAVSAYQLILEMAAFPSACYLRAVRGDLPILYGDGEAFPLGGHKVLRKAGDGSTRVVLVGSGYLVHSCLEAADKLSARGTEVAVVDAYSLPMDTSSVLAMARPGGIVLTVEDNYVGGIGSELAEAAAAMSGGAPQVRALTVRNIPKSGRTPEDVLAYVHLSVDEIVGAVAGATR